MKVIVCTKYGKSNALRLKDVPKPTPKDNELLIKVYATTVASGDVVRLQLGGFLKVKDGILGQEFAGVVEALGKNVGAYKKGDQVFGITDTGTHAEYVCVSKKSALAIKPSNISFEEAASLPFGTGPTLFFLQKLANIRSGQKILIYGASGAVGTSAVQYAKYIGAEVAGVCSTKNLELVRSLGADRVIDYKKDDFRKNGQVYDIVFDSVGKITFSSCKNSLKEKGIFVTTVLNIPIIAYRLWTSMLSSKKVKCGITFGSVEDMIVLKDLIVQEKITAVIDKLYPLEKVPEAFRYVEKGHKVGNVVISLEQN